MNPRHIIPWLVPLLASPSFGKPEFVGVLSDSGGTYAAVRLESTQNTIWVAVGGSFSGYRISAYNPETEILMLKQPDDSSLELKLKGASVKPALNLSMFEYLAKSSDLEKKKQYLKALQFEALRKQTVAALTKALELNAPEDSELIINLRNQLSVCDDNLTRQLSLLVKAIQPAPADAK